jgi:hypothetical protein
MIRILKKIYNALILIKLDLRAIFTSLFEFNAHRVFNPVTIVRLADNLDIKLRRFFYLTETGFIDPNNIGVDVASFTNKKYSLGIFFLARI